MTTRHSVFMLLMLALLMLALWCSGCGAQSAPSQANAAPLPSPVQSPSPGPTPFVDRPQAKPIETTWASKFEFDTKTIAEKFDGHRSYEISVEYPQIMRARNQRASSFNRWIKRKVLGDVARFKRLERAAEYHDRKMPPAVIAESLDLTHRIYYSDDNLISLRLTHSVMALGQMHPINYYETINYNLKTGRPLRPQDVFKRGYLKVIAAYCRGELMRIFNDGQEDSLINEGTRPKMRNFANWNIVPDGILVSFEDYQVGAHTMGQPELIVPYSVLDGYMLKKSMVQ